MINLPPGLLDRLHLPGPRYTSYPTVMHWGAAPVAADWLNGFAQALQDSESRCGLYVHVPFCQSLCTFCGCNMRLARNHAMAAPYVQTLLREFALYRAQLAMPSLTLGELHLGGGSPTWMPAGELDRLLDGLLQQVSVTRDAPLAIEADPRNTTREQLQVLRRHGFNAVSIGVQDFDPRVLEIVNRPQSTEDVRRTVDEARALGFRTVSFDLIFGLPLQTLDSLSATFDIVEDLGPDRVTFLPYAHVPWIKQSQRRYTEADLPDALTRQQLYLLGRSRMNAAGFAEIGLDQYARGHDPLAEALASGTLHRSFMGFSASPTNALLGLGVSAIGDNRLAYAQNEKNLQQYESRVQAGELPLQRGHLLTPTDLRIRELLWQLLTRSKANVVEADRAAAWWKPTTATLAALQADGIVTMNADTIAVTRLGRAFLRHVGMAFDQYLHAAP